MQSHASPVAPGLVVFALKLHDSCRGTRAADGGDELFAFAPFPDQAALARKPRGIATQGRVVPETDLEEATIIQWSTPDSPRRGRRCQGQRPGDPETCLARRPGRTHPGPSEVAEEGI